MDPFKHAGPGFEGKPYNIDLTLIARIALFVIQYPRGKVCSGESRTDRF
jgi:hypothetical protein